MRKKSKYAAIGFVVSKFVLPAAKRRAKQQAKAKARGAVVGPARAAKRHPARASVAVGAAVGAIGWLVSRRRGGGDDTSGPSGN